MSDTLEMKGVGWRVTANRINSGKGYAATIILREDKSPKHLSLTTVLCADLRRVAGKLIFAEGEKEQKDSE